MSQINYSLLAIPKGTPAKVLRARAKRQHAAARAKCRAIVYKRAGGRCEHCWTPLVLKPSHARHEFQIAHIHEVVMRSQGGSDTDPDNCLCLCYIHHAEAHGR